MQSESNSSGKKLKCRNCGKVTEHSTEEMLAFVQSGWPHCCDDTMEFMPLNEPKPPKNKLEMPEDD